MAGLVETHVQPQTEAGLQAFFGDLPTDLSFMQKTSMIVAPTTYAEITPGNFINFEIGRLEGPQVYLLKDLFLRAEVALTINGSLATPLLQPQRMYMPDISPSTSSGRGRGRPRGSRSSVSVSSATGFQGTLNKVAPVNNLLHSMIDSLDLILENTNLNPESKNYAYSAYIKNLTSFDQLVKDSWLETGKKIRYFKFFIILI